MSEPAAFKYWAFVSYSHRDKAIAGAMHSALERYRVPRRLVGRIGRDGAVPRRIVPLFRDLDELPTSSDLGSAIREALAASRYLIVVCSPSAAASIWVNQEVLEFKRLGRANRILCLIVDGEPNASSKPGASRECFCPALRHAVDAEGRLTAEPVEPLAADIRPGNDSRWDARLKLVAGLIGINYDDLKQREKSRQRWRHVLAAAAAIALTIGVAGSWMAINDRAQEARRQQIFATTRNAAKLLEDQFYVGVITQALTVLPARLRPDQDPPHELVALLEQALDRNRFETLLRGHANEADSLAVARQGDRLVTASLDRSVRIWDIGAGTSETLSTGPRSRHAILSPNGDRVAAAGDDGRIRIYDAGSRALLRELTGHQPGKIVRRLAFDAAGDLLISGSDDGTGRIWDARSGAERFVLEGHRTGVHAVLYSSDKRLAVTISNDAAMLWSVDDGRRLATLAGAGVGFRTGAVDPQGARLALAIGRQINLWDIADATAPRMVATLQHKGLLNALAFDQTGARLASASEDRTARLWDVATGRLIEKMPHGDSVRDVVFNAAGDRIATASNDFTARLWDGHSGEPIPYQMLRGHTQYVFALAFAPSGQWLVTSSGINARGDPSLRLWDMKPRPERTLTGHNEPVRRAVFSPGGDRIATAALDGRVLFWDAGTLALIPDLDFVHHDGAVYSVAFDPTGTRVVTASADRTARIWDLATGRSIELGGHDARVTYASFDPSGQRVVTVSGTKARVLDAATGQPLDIVLQHSKEPFSAMFNRSGDLLLTAEHDERALIWDARTGRQLQVLGKSNGHNKSVNWASFDPSGTRAVTVSDDETARIWNVADGTLIGAPLRHEAGEWVLGAAFHPTQSLLVTSTLMGRLYFWDLQTSRLLAIRHAHNGDYIYSVAFDPSGSRLVTASRDQTAAVHPVRIDHQATSDRARAVVARIGSRP
jgi:WD40 repeat protein